MKTFSRIGRKIFRPKRQNFLLLFAVVVVLNFFILIRMEHQPAVVRRVQTFSELKPLNLVNSSLFSDHPKVAENDLICKNSEQGILIADDRGNVCDRGHLNSTSGCCVTEAHNRDYCSNNVQCDATTSCCLHYEYCISCCLDNISATEDLRSIPILKHRSSFESNFDKCRAICRTSSRSVQHENAYRSEFKYCFGSSAPPLIPKIRSGEAKVSLMSENDLEEERKFVRGQLR